MDRIERNFQRLLGWFQVNFGWVKLVHSSQVAGLGLHPVLIPEVEQLRGCWLVMAATMHSTI